MTGVFAAILVAVMVMLVLAARNSNQRDRDESAVVFSENSSLSAAAIKACLLEKPAQGLWLDQKRQSLPLRNNARHQLLTIRDLGAARKVVMFQRSDYQLRPGERAQLERCTGPARNTSS